jgi:hypothetical protein
MVLLAACSSGNDATTTTVPRVVSERRAAMAWSDRAQVAYKPLQLTGLQLPERVRAWQAAERSDDELRADLATATSEVLAVREAVADLPAFELDDRVAPLYEWSSRLYVEYVRVLQGASAQPPGALRDQLVLSARRLRVLGDRVFDRGQARLTPFLHEAPNPDVVIQLPPEVPDWTADAMAAGPPLDDPPPPPASTPALREESRPTQPRAGWAAAVQATGVPTEAEVGALIATGDVAGLRTAANRCAGIARDLAAVADPVGRHGREDGAQVRLAVLVTGEAARAAQAGLPDVGRSLAAIGAEVLAVPGLPPRS